MADPVVKRAPHPNKVAAAQRVARARFGEKRVIKLHELSDPDRRLALALVAAVKAAAAEKAASDGE